MANYRRDLNSVWREMERLHSRGEFRPEQEGDVQAYLYHGLLTRLRKDGVRPVDIRTEETFERVGRVDLNVNDRLFIEIKLLSRRGSYGAKGWRKKARSLRYDAWKLKQYLKSVKSESLGVHLRQPVLALWNWKADAEGLHEDLQARLESFRQRMRDQGVVVMYGPKGPR